MKKDLTTTLLQVAIGVILLSSVICCLKYVFASREIRSLNYKLRDANTHRNVVQAFVADCMAYSDKNPAILPLLESVGVKKNAAAPAKPAK